MRVSPRPRAFGFQGHGVVIYAAVCVAWCLFVTLLILRLGYPAAFHALGVPAQEHPFGDMRIVVDGIELAGRGQDVIGVDYLPRYYFPIRFPYPRTWLVFRHFGVTDAHTEALAIVLGLAMVLHFGLLIARTGNRAFTGLVLAAFACSPPVMLGLERGNTDLLVYLLVAGGCHALAGQSLKSQSAGAVLLFSAGALKFFPFASVLGMIPGQRLRRWWPLATFIVAAVLWLVFERGDLMRIVSSPHASSDWASFGSAVSANELSRLFTRVTGIDLPTFVPGFLRWGGVVVLALITRRQARLIGRDGASVEGLGRVEAAGFGAGAGVFAASFVLMRSYNYKFIFLALALPALCEWSRRKDQCGRTALLAVATLLLWVWSGLNGYLYLGVNIFVSWLCVGCVASLLLAWVGQHAVIPPCLAGPASPFPTAEKERQ